MAVDEATARLLAELAKSVGKHLDEMSPEEARGFGSVLRDMYGPGPAVASSTDYPVETSDGDSIRVRVLAMDNSRGTIVYFHGGGWVIGAVDEFDTLGRQLADRTGCTVVLVDYRLAPEHRCPVAAEDAWTALRWVAAQEFSGGPLIVAGDSAGGNLAAVVAQRARAENSVEIALQVLVYPVVDCELDRPSYVAPENQLLISRAAMIWFWNHYAPDLADRRRPDVSPLQADDLSRLPPAVVVTAEHDPLRDEGEAYAERLRAAGVRVEARRFTGQMHGFFTLAGLLPGQQAGLEYVAAQIDRALLEGKQPA